MLACKPCLASGLQQARPRAAFRQATRTRLAVRAQSGEEDRELESQFEKELRRRGLDGSASAADDSYAAAPRSPFEQQQQQQGPRRATRPPPSFRGEGTDDVPPQLAYSRALNSEGLEGFIPRATELLKLGASFFLGFLPFIVVVGLAFGGVYAIFGEAFVHGGSPSSGPPPYIDPDMLLADPGAEGMVPLDLR